MSLLKRPLRFLVGQGLGSVFGRNAVRIRIGTPNLNSYGYAHDWPNSTCTNQHIVPDYRLTGLYTSGAGLLVVNFAGADPASGGSVTVTIEGAGASSYVALWNGANSRYELAAQTVLRTYLISQADELLTITISV